MTTIPLQEVSLSQATSITVDLPKHWKDIGYRGYYEFLASDNDFMVFRRYGTLNAGLLLYLQDQIAVHEGELRFLEDSHADTDAADVHNGSFQQDMVPERKVLLDKILAKVEEYSKSSVLSFFC
jgi:hypothetical protein